jgi:hypothetical protein
MPFLKDLGIKAETAIFTKHYDVLYVSLNCDLNLWSTYKSYHAPKKTKIILDLSDNYLADSYINSAIRSIAHFLFRRTKSLILDYRHTIQKMLQVSDLVTVGSLEQQSEISYYHSNVVVVRDFFDEDICTDPLCKSGELDSSVNILWEGFSHGSLPIFNRFKNIVSTYDSSFGNINLHVVTDSKICSLMGRFFCAGTEKTLKKLFKNTIVTVKFYEWTMENLNVASSQCNFAMILIPDVPFMRSKPENKLLLCWSLGLPALASDTPSYNRVMRDSGNSDSALSTDDEWRLMLKEFSKNKAKRDRNLTNGLNYIAGKMSYDLMLETWRSIFNCEK